VRGALPDRRQAEQRLCAAWFQPDLTEEDRDWLRRHIELGGQQVPEVDTSWIEMDYCR